MSNSNSKHNIFRVHIEIKMEFEILNEIMTSTVAQLFTINRQSHLKFFKNSS